jgi:predicted metallo-beta-lactamase superfamily hydrolase
MIFKWINKYSNLQGFLNKCYYDSYNKIDFSKKPTTIYSNKKMLLKKNNVKNNNNRITRNNNFNDKVKKGIIKLEDFNIKKDYCERSKVPIELYKHILSIYEGKEQLNLF